MSDFQRAIDRMCTPLDPTHLRGVTAECDARDMALIRETVKFLRAAVTELRIELLSAAPEMARSLLMRGIEDLLERTK